MRPGFRPVFPGMAAGIDTDETIIPIRWWPLLIMPLQTARIIGTGIAEQAGKLHLPLAVGNQTVEIIMAAFVTEVSQQGAVRLGHLLTHFFAVSRVSLGDIDRDHAIGMTGHHMLAIGTIFEKLKRQTLLTIVSLGRWLQLQTPERIQQAPLGHFQALPIGFILFGIERRNDRGQPAGSTQRVSLGIVNHPIADALPLIVIALPEQPAGIDRIDAAPTRGGALHWRLAGQCETADDL